MRHEESRPDPDALLRRVQAEERRARGGRLRLYFGAHAGVGKTYAMLREARQRRAEGVDVVVGIVETHGRGETEALLEGLEVLARRTVEHQGARLGEFDLDAALARRPQLILVDELAHANAAGSRHAKRWQDVEELLAAGIDVDTTLNVQHVESLGDVVARITQATQRETVPDRLLDRADEVVLIDLPPEQFQRRLAEGKVYVPEQARRAADHFFRKGNLIALRELALRRTAERVDAQMRDWRTAEAITQTWAAGERLLVGVGPSPFSQRLVRATRRMAASLHCEWLAVFVETPRTKSMSREGRARVEQGLRMARQLGARTETISGEDFAKTLLAYARRQNVTRLVVGKPRRRSPRDYLFGTLVDRLIRDCGDIDVYVITGEEGEESRPAVAPVARRRRRWSGYARAVLVVAIVSAAAALLHGRIVPANLIMLYLLGLVLVARRGERGPAILAAVLSVATFDFFFVPPHLTLAVADTEYLLTFFIMLLTGLIISDLVVRVRNQAELAGHRERTSSLLHELAGELSAAGDREGMLRRAVDCLGRVLEVPCALLLPGVEAGSPPRATTRAWDELSSDARELGAAQWVITHGQPAGRGTQTLPAAAGFYLPLQGRRGAIGALGLRLEPESPPSSERLRLFETVAAQLGQALERETLREEARAASIRLESEQVRNTLLSSVSHELRTPLTVIAGAAESLDQLAEIPAGSHELVTLIRDEAGRLDRLVQNLLQMSRMDAGMLQLRTELQVPEELVGNALARLDYLLAARNVELRIDPDLPLVEADGLLIEQVLINLLENAHKFSPPEAPITLHGELRGDRVALRVCDGGPGIDEAGSEALFQRFVQGEAVPKGARPGVGLGLALSAAIVRLHGGRIWAHNLPEGGGAEFGFCLPAAGEVPAPQSVPLDEAPA